MAWKPKEKPLTLEEAIVLAKNELAPFWHGTEPLIAGVQVEDKVSAFPLSSAFSKSAWLLFFIDPTDFSGETALAYAREWFDRYSIHHLGVIAIFRPIYSFQKNREFVQELVKKLGLRFYLAIDGDGMLASAFGVNEHKLPKVLLIQGQEIIFNRDGKNWMTSAEVRVQEFLRSKDPGLALLPEFRPVEKLSYDFSRIELGSQKKAQFSKPGFGELVKGSCSASFGTEVGNTDVKLGTIYLSGRWVQDAERISTSDPAATLKFSSPTSKVAVVFESTTHISEPAKAHVEIGGVYVFDSWAGQDLTTSEEGKTLVKVIYGRSYQVLKELSDEERTVTFRFPSSDRIPIAIYGIRFGNE